MNGLAVLLAPPDGPLALPGRRKFSPAEDALLQFFVEVPRTPSWSKVARQIPGRTPRQCRDRHCIYVCARPFHSPWTVDEDLAIIRGFQMLRPKWSLIATFLPGRNSVEVKNRWYRHIALQPKPQRTFAEDAERFERRAKRRTEQGQGQAKSARPGQSGWLWESNAELNPEPDIWSA
jgi:hypothetical protein